MLSWPVRDGLILHLHRLRERAIVQFRHQQLIYVLGGASHPPTLPPILMNIEEE